VRCTIEEAEIGVAMQFGVPSPFGHPASLRTYVRLDKSQEVVTDGTAGREGLPKSVAYRWLSHY
jgi:hypothetical protein